MKIFEKTEALELLDSLFQELCIATEKCETEEGRNYMREQYQMEIDFIIENM